MPTDPVPSSRHALPWTQPLPPAAARWLADQARWTGEGPLDLRRHLVVVPTRQSGRRLREALAQLTAAHDQAVLSPQVVVPSQVPRRLAPGMAPSASRLEVSLAWARVLQDVEWRDHRAVLPVPPVENTLGWARGLGERLMRVQQALAEEGLCFGDVAARDGVPETERWRQLAALEIQFETTLADHGFVSPGRAEREALGDATLPPGIDRVVLLAVPELPTIALSYLHKIAEHVTAVIHDDLPPAEAARAYDDWGRPTADYWLGRTLPWQDFDHQVQLAADPTAQAEAAAARAAAHPRPAEWLTLTVLDSETLPPLERALGERDISVYHPEGEPWNRGPLHGLLQALVAWVESPAVRPLGNLLRHPAVLRWFAQNLPADGADPSRGPVATRLLRQWDDLREEHLVADLAAARAQAHSRPLLAAALAQLAAWRDELLDGDFVNVARSLPERLLAGETFERGGALAEAARHWVDGVEHVAEATRFLPGLSPAECWELALAQFSQGARFASKPPDALDLGGWLELLWSDTAHLVLIGANEGLLPETIHGDSFLPENLRELLGMRRNAHRIARDTYLLTAAMAARPESGAVTILVGKAAASGEPRRPSQLLLAGAGEALPGRVQQLFRAVETVAAAEPWQRAWQLAPPHRPPPERVSVTSLRDWLHCPFRFYLSRVLRMESVDLGKTELNAMDFGTLVHAALQAMGEDEVLKTLTDPAELAAGLLEHYDRQARRDYGREPSLPVQMQLESGRQRLRRAAEVEVEQRLAGWQTVAVEQPFEIDLGGLGVRGKIDRIDRHEDGGVRVIDYKTSDRPTDPLSAHVASLREEDATRPDWLRVEIKGKERRWTDLQLPLYRLALAEQWGHALSCAYFNLPKAVGQTGLAFWPTEGEALQESAVACARGAAAAIRAGEFWPPIEQRGPYDGEWDGLFLQGVQASVVENWGQDSEVRS